MDYRLAEKIINSLYGSIPVLLKGLIATEKDCVFISMPDYFRQGFEKCINEKMTGVGGPQFDKVDTFRGIKIIPNHENAVCIFHKDHPMIPESFPSVKVYL